MKNRTSLDAAESLERPTTRQLKSRNEGKIWEIMVKEQKRKRLIDELQDIEDNLEDRLKDNFNHVLQDLDKIALKAQQNDIPDIKQIVHFNILRDRLRNLPQQVKHSGFTKRQVDNPFRSARIEQFDYRQVEQEKLSQNSLLVYPNQWGKGFKPYYWGNGFNSEDKNDMRKIPKDREKYNYAFEYVKYIETVKIVNQIFFNGFKDTQRAVRQVATKIQAMCLFLALLLALGILTFLNTPSNNYFVESIFCILGVSLIVLVCFTQLLVSFRYYIHKPSQQTEIEFIGQQILLHLNEMNYKNKEDERIIHKYEWKCHSDLMYLEVYFPKGIPSGPQANEIL